jgi:Kef-type K+ transport system membrane component KefB
VVLSLVTAFARASESGVDAVQIVLVAGRIVLFFAAGIFIGRWITPFLRWATRLEVSQGLLAATLVIAFVYAWAAEYLGQVAAITGSYLAGVLIAQTPFKIMVLVTTMVTPPLLRLTFPTPTRRIEDVTVEETIAGPPQEAEDAR